MYDIVCKLRCNTGLTCDGNFMAHHFMSNRLDINGCQWCFTSVGIKIMLSPSLYDHWLFKTEIGMPAVKHMVPLILQILSGKPPSLLIWSKLWCTRSWISSSLQFLLHCNVCWPGWQQRAIYSYQSPSVGHGSATLHCQPGLPWIVWMTLPGPVLLLFVAILIKCWDTRSWSCGCTVVHWQLNKWVEWETSLLLCSMG